MAVEKDFETYRGKLQAYRKGEPTPLVMADDGRYSLEYVPFEYVNRDAKIVLVGITPGPNQRDLAYKEASSLLRRGVEDAEVKRLVKKIAAFGSPTMRPNLERMLDTMGICALLGVARAADLWGIHYGLLHATSVVPHAAFIGGKPFAGSFQEIQRTAILRASFERDFLPTLGGIGEQALFVGLGPTPAAALSFAADAGIIKQERLLGWLAHPSSTGGSQVKIYLGERLPADLKDGDPVRRRVESLLTAASEMRRRVLALKNQIDCDPA